MKPSRSAMAPWACCSGARATPCASRWIAAICGMSVRRSASPRCGTSSTGAPCNDRRQQPHGRVQRRLRLELRLRRPAHEAPCRPRRDRARPVANRRGFELNLATAEGIARLTGGTERRMFVNAGTVKDQWRSCEFPARALKKSPAQDARLREETRLRSAAHRRERGLRWFEQQAADGFAYAVCVAWKRVGKRRCSRSLWPRGTRARARRL